MQFSRSLGAHWNMIRSCALWRRAAGEVAFSMLVRTLSQTCVFIASFYVVRIERRIVSTLTDFLCQMHRSSLVIWELVPAGFLLVLCVFVNMAEMLEGRRKHSVSVSPEKGGSFSFYCPSFAGPKAPTKWGKITTRSSFFALSQLELNGAGI